MFSAMQIQNTCIQNNMLIKYVQALTALYYTCGEYWKYITNSQTNQNMFIISKHGVVVSWYGTVQVSLFVNCLVILSK